MAIPEIKYTIGILALQGDVSEHIKSIEAMGHTALAVKYAKQLLAVDGLIIPGGESTTINRLSDNQARELFLLVRKRALSGDFPIYGTCMGTIMLAKNILGSDQESLALMDITVERNAYGPQKASFETTIPIKDLEGAPYQAVFIRAPAIKSADRHVEVLGTVDGKIVIARQGNFLASTFHPELTDDQRVHQLFIEMVQKSKSNLYSASLETVAVSA